MGTYGNASSVVVSFYALMIDVFYEFPILHYACTHDRAFINALIFSPVSHFPEICLARYLIFHSLRSLVYRSIIILAIAPGWFLKTYRRLTWKCYEISTQLFQRFTRICITPPINQATWYYSLVDLESWSKSRLSFKIRSINPWLENIRIT